MKVATASPRLPKASLNGEAPDQSARTLSAAVSACLRSGRVGVDTETTGLDPRKHRVRLLQLAPDASSTVFVLDLFKIPIDALAPLWDALATTELVLHNALFDLSFLARLGFAPTGGVADTMLLAQLLTAGTTDKVSLAACCERWLKQAVDKGEQKSDWSGDLTREQLEYAARDAAVLLPLHEVLTAEIEKAGLSQVAEIETRCLPAIVWLSSAGVQIDKPAWQALADAAETEAKKLAKKLTGLAPARPDGEPWNFGSPKQLAEVFGLLGVDLPRTAKGNPSTSDAVLAALDHPFATLLRDYRGAAKLTSTYGNKWLENVAEDGRVYADWRQIGSRAGRMAAREPNMQQLPRPTDRANYRRCITARPGCVLVKADYSQIEVRIAAKISGDKALLEAYQEGADLHTLTARAVLGVEEPTKEHRQLAKILNFGLIYGMGVRRLVEYARTLYGLTLSEGEASRYRSAFFKQYSGLDAWHKETARIHRAHESRSRFSAQTRAQLSLYPETRTLAGRRRLLDATCPLTFRLNSPVQGTSADGLKLALALLWERRHECPNARPVIVAHDEILVEAPEDQAEAVSGWLKSAMMDAMAPLIDPVPCAVDFSVGRTWGG